MDILLKLRVLIWILILALWGMMVYQFLGEEEQDKARMAYVANPYKNGRSPTDSGSGTSAPYGAVGRPPTDSGSGTSAPYGAVAPLPHPPPEPPVPSQPSAPPPAQAPELVRTPDVLKPLPPRVPAPKPAPRPPMRREAEAPPPDAPAPRGFARSTTRHFTVYAEKDPASEKFVELLEGLHGNLMLDLAPFSPWAREEKVAVFLFRSQDTYRDVTGRPPWSGGASSVARRKVYVYESDELPGILAHELCHIYYDSFFPEGKPPLWISEGMATLVQVERGLAAPNWLRENLEILEQGGGFPVSELVTVNSTAGASDEKVRLWYAQAYSTVRFLIRTQTRANFYNFSRHLGEGRPAHEALFRAYGMPFNRLKALEYAWRHELAKKSP